MLVETGGRRVEVESVCRTGTAVLHLQRNPIEELTDCLPSADLDHPIDNPSNGYKSRAGMRLRLILR